MPTSRIVPIATTGGTIPTRIFRPDGDGPFRALILFQDGVGVRPTLEAMAARASALDYVVALPDMYWRSSGFVPPPPATVFSDPEQRATLMKVMAEITPARAADDTRAVLDALAKEPGVLAEKVGVFGYCLGGRLSLLAAASEPERVAAAMVVHGGGLVTDAAESPHRQATRIRARVHVAAPETDPSLTPEMREQLHEALEGAGVEHTIEVHPGTKHGFAVPDFPVYDRDAAEAHWARLQGFFAS